MSYSLVASPLIPPKILPHIISYITPFEDLTLYFKKGRVEDLRFRAFIVTLK